MKKSIFILTLICTFFYNNSVTAHVEGHEKITVMQALQISVSTVKKMTFKDSGFGVGKIDKSWNDVDKSNFILSDISANNYIIKGVNETIDQVLYFTVNESGEVVNVEQKK